MIEFELINDKQVYHKMWQEQKLSFLQSWPWGEVKSKTNQPIRLRCRLDDGYEFPFTVYLKKFPFFSATFGYIPRFANEKIVQKLDAQFLLELRKYLKSKFATKFLLVEPLVLKDNLEFASNLIEKMNKQPITIQPNETDIIKLEGTDDEMMGRMDKGTRYEIRKAIKNGCEVTVSEWSGDEKINAENIDRFFAVMQDIYARTDYVMYGRQYYANIFSLLGPANMCRIFYVQRDGKDVGAMMHYMDADTTYEINGGATDVGRKLSANYLLKWEAMKTCRDEGYKYFDQWGVSPQICDESGHCSFEKDHPWYHISKFKSGFGGQYTEYIGQWADVYSSIWFWLYRARLMINDLFIKAKAILGRK